MGTTHFPQWQGKGRVWSIHPLGSASSCSDKLVGSESQRGMQPHPLHHLSRGYSRSLTVPQH